MFRIERRAFLLASTMLLARPQRAGAEPEPRLSEETRMRLLDRVRRRGRLPVVLGLKLPEVATRQAAIAQAGEQLLADLRVRRQADGSLAGPGIANVKLFATLPFLALTATPEALEGLLRHPLVASAQEDRAAGP